MLVVENNSVYEIDEECLKEEVCQRNVRYTRRLSESGKWQRTKRKNQSNDKNHPDREVWVVYRSGEL